MRINQRSRRNAHLSLVLVLPLFLMSFAAKCDGNKNKGGNGNANADVNKEREVDDLLRIKVRENLTAQSNNSNTGLRVLDVEVGVSKRKVTLTGSVSSQAALDEAVRVARDTEVERGGEKFKPSGVDVGGLTVARPSPSSSPSSSPSP
jgi:hypothetical protein